MLRKWWKRHSEITKKIGGLAEKEEATKRKLEVAMKILGTSQPERREKAIPVEWEKRLQTQTNGI